MLKLPNLKSSAAILFSVLSLDLIATYLTYLHIESVIILHHAPREADAAIVFFDDFGNHRGLSAESLSRVSKALELYNAGVVTNITCVGGARKSSRRYGSVLMCEELQRQGVTQEALFLETESFDSFGNWAEAQTIIATNGWSKVVLVSSFAHLFRLSVISRDAPEGVSVYLAQTSEEGRGLMSSLWKKWLNIHYEYLAWLFYFSPAQFRISAAKSLRR